MSSWLVKAVAAGIVLVVLLARAVRLPAPEAPARSEPGATYRQLRHLMVATVFLVLGLVLILWLAPRIGEVLTLLAIALILAVALRPTVDRLSGLGIPLLRPTIRRALAILIIYLVLATIGTGIGLLAIPLIVDEVEKLIAASPEYLRGLDQTMRGLQQRYPWMPDLVTLEGLLVNQLLGNLSQAIDVLLFAANVVGGLFSIGLILMLTFFLIMDADPIYEHVTSLVSPSRRDQVRAMTARMGRKIEGWLKGTLLLSAILGSVTGVAMWLLGMPYPLLLGLAAGLFELLPMVGAYLGSAPAVIVALIIGPPWRFLAVLLYFVAIQQVENNVLAPQVMGREVEMPPLLVILALLVGASLMGILGALLAVPVAAVLQVLWLDLVVREIRRRQVEA